MILIYIIKKLEEKNLIICTSNCQTLMQPAQSICATCAANCDTNYLIFAWSIANATMIALFFLLSRSKLRQKPALSYFTAEDKFALVSRFISITWANILLKYGGAKRLKQRFSLLLCHRLRNAANKIVSRTGNYFNFYVRNAICI